LAIHKPQRVVRPEPSALTLARARRRSKGSWISSRSNSAMAASMVTRKQAALSASSCALQRSPAAFISGRWPLGDSEMAQDESGVWPLGGLAVQAKTHQWTPPDAN
jgi:hypothetical protein